MAGGLKKPERTLKLPKGIRRKPNGKFIAEPSYKGKRDSETCNTLDEAIEARTRIYNRLVQEHNEAEEQASTWTIQNAYDRTYAMRWKGKVSEKQNRIKFEELCEYCGGPDTPITRFTTDFVDMWTDWLINEKGNGDATINRKYAHLSTILKVAHKRGHLALLPELQKREEKSNRIRFLTIPEEHKIINLFIHHGKGRHAVCTALLVDTGFRPNEFWSLNASQVNLQNRVISLWETKTRKPRTIPMTQRVFEIISQLLIIRPVGKLLPGANNNWFGNGWERIRILMNLTKDKDFVPYSLRHTCCSRLVQRGVPLNHAQKWMGHDSITTTMRYAHLAPHDLFPLASVLDGGEQARWSAVSTEAAGPDAIKAVTLPDGMTWASLTQESWGLAAKYDRSQKVAKVV